MVQVPEKGKLRRGHHQPAPGAIVGWNAGPVGLADQ